MSKFQQNEQTKILQIQKPKLTKIVKTSHLNDYACYSKRAPGKLLFLTSTTPNSTENIELCEKIIKEQLIHNLVCKETLNPQFREISSLPLKMGGLNIKLPSDHKNYVKWSRETSIVQENQDPVTAKTQHEKIFMKIKKFKTDITNRKKKQTSLTP